MAPRIRQLRPRQWLKNVLLAAAPFAAGVTAIDDVVLIGIGFTAFSLVASALYIMNDLFDIDADRAHPEKRHRPLASGSQSSAGAVMTLVGLAAIGFGISLALPIEFTLVLVGYSGNTIVYTLRGKHVPILDMLQVAGGFMARLIAGAVIVDVDISPWFLTVSLFGSLLMISGKRVAEKRRPVEHAATRPSIARLSEHFLDQVVMIATSGLIFSYALWALDAVEETQAVTEAWSIASLAPFLFCVLRYLLLIDQGKSEKPEDAVLDVPLLLGATAWIISISAGVYG
ncbi:MAG: decaprenyl-phosphate phosphoribosyltransferase [Ilumatobacter sp.]|nr:decaprenyl-phosphate phosphoribosyltransferase [Ilumatobacter sp.]